jgi:cytidyltransferase-like protein
MEKKLRYKMSIEAETQYFKLINEIADNVIKGIDCTKEYKKTISNLNKNVFEVIKTEYPDHSKKTELNIRDDIFLSSKLKLMRFLPGNNNALFLGRFQPPTKMHIQIIEDALKSFDNIVIAIVKGKKSEKSLNPFPFELQKKMFTDKFPNVEILQVGSGNIFGIISKVEHNINSILAGSDRVEGYKKQLQKTPDTNVHEIKRSHNSVSSTKVRQSITTRNYKNFTDNMDKSHYKYWETLYFLLHPDELQGKLQELQKFESFKKYLSIKEAVHKYK